MSFEPYLTEDGRFVYARQFLHEADAHATLLSIINVHSENECSGRACVIHNPSNHSMRGFPLHWRGDRGIFERICPHGIGHPDPDSLYYEEQQADQEGDIEHEYVGIHGCDGCCWPTRTDGDSCEITA